MLISTPDSGTVGSAPLIIAKFVSSGRSNHLPLLVIPINTGSNKLRSIEFKMPFADTHEISCSLLLPPQIIAILDLLIKFQP